MKGFGAFSIVAAVIALGIAFINRCVVDADGFYHLGHAQLYWEQGITYRDFPWAAYSVISQHRSDLWWGFHVLLTPVAGISNRELQMAMAQAMLLFLNLLIGRFAFVQLKLPQWWSLALLPASVGYLARMDTIRPQALSSGLLVLYFAALTTESTFLALASAVAIGFVHPTLSYMMVLVSVGVLLNKKKGIALSVSSLVVAVSVAVIRPGIPDGLELLKVQLYDLMLLRKSGIIPNFGVELNPADTYYFMRGLLSPMIMLLVAVMFAFRKQKPKVENQALGAMIVAIGGLLISNFLTRRGVDQFAPFTILTAILIVHQTGGLNRIFAILMGIHAGVTFGFWLDGPVQRGFRSNVSDYRGAMEFLKTRTEPGEIVGQGVWSDFGPMFYWSRHNRYFGGMDPTFQYKYDPATYWNMTIAAVDRDLGRTGPTIPPGRSKVEEPVSTVWSRDLKVRWFVLAKNWQVELQKALQKDSKIKVRFEDERTRVYEIIP